MYFSEKPDTQLCDIRRWYLTSSAQGKFDGVRTPDQQRILSDIEEMMIKGQSDPNYRYLECDALNKFILGLQGTEQQDQQKDESTVLTETGLGLDSSTLDGKQTATDISGIALSTDENSDKQLDESELDESEVDGGEVDETELDESETTDDDMFDETPNVESEISASEQPITDHVIDKQPIDMDDYVKNVFEGNTIQEQQVGSEGVINDSHDATNDSHDATNDSHDATNDSQDGVHTDVVNAQSDMSIKGNSNIVNETNKILPKRILNNFGVCRVQHSLPLDVFDKYLLMESINNNTHENISREAFLPFYIRPSKFVLSPSNCLMPCLKHTIPPQENNNINEGTHDGKGGDTTDDGTVNRNTNNGNEIYLTEKQTEEKKGKQNDIESEQVPGAILNDKHSQRDDKQKDDEKEEVIDDKMDILRDDMKQVDGSDKERDVRDGEEDVDRNDKMETVKDDKNKIDDRDKDDRDKKRLRNEEDYSTNIDVDHLQELILSKTKNYENKMQSLELVIMKLENEILLEKLSKHNHSSSMSRLENHILKLENELLKMNQTYYELKFDNELLKKRQRRYLELGHTSENTSKPSNEIITEQHAKISQLSQLLRNQSKAITEMRTRSDYLEDQNRMLYQMVMNQTALMSQIMMRVQELSEQNIKQREEAQTLREQIQTKDITKSRGDKHTELKDLSNKMLRDIDRIVSDTKLSDNNEDYAPRNVAVEKEIACTYKFQKKWCFSDVMCVCNAIVYSWCPPYGAVFWTECGAVYHRKVRKEDEFGPYAEDVVTSDAGPRDIANEVIGNLPDVLSVIDDNHGTADLHQHLLADSDLIDSKQVETFQSGMTYSDSTQQESDERVIDNKNPVNEMTVDTQPSDNTKNVNQQDDNTKTANQQDDNAKTVNQQDDTTKTANQQDDNTKTVNQQDDNTKTANQQDDGTKTVNQQVDYTKNINQQADNTKHVNQQDDNAKTVNQQVDTTNTVNQQTDNIKHVNKQDDNTKTINQQVDITKTVNQQADNTKTLNQEVDTTNTVNQQTDKTKPVNQQVDNTKHANPQAGSTNIVNEQADNIKTENGSTENNQQVENSKATNKKMDNVMATNKHDDVNEADNKNTKDKQAPNQQAGNTQKPKQKNQKPKRMSPKYAGTSTQKEPKGQYFL